MLLSKTDPVTCYNNALTRIETDYQKGQAEHVREICLPTLMTHGAPTAWTLVFLHGFTSCPEQFSQLGRHFFDLGHNIYVPRQPGELESISPGDRLEVAA